MANANLLNKNRTLVTNKLEGSGSAPTAAAGTGAGTTPTLAVTGTDLCGKISITTGSSPAATNAILATLTFASAWGSTPYCTISPANAAAAALSGATACFVDQASGDTTKFVIKAGSTALTGATAYLFNYYCQA